jgi:carboxylesterase type B
MFAKQILLSKLKKNIRDALLFTKSKVRVNVNAGVVKGCRERLPNGNTFLRFSNVKYAKVPINDLKFRSPQKLLKFENGEIDCSKEGDPSFHRSLVHR